MRRRIPSNCVLGSPQRNLLTKAHFEHMSTRVSLQVTRARNKSLACHISERVLMLSKLLPKLQGISTDCSLQRGLSRDVGLSTWVKLHLIWDTWSTTELLVILIYELTCERNGREVIMKHNIACRNRVHVA